MKKSTRIISLFMAVMMLMGTFSVLGSASVAYKGNAITYNDVDAPVFTTEQYATMGLDEVDRMLAEEQLLVNIYVGTLDLRSIDYAIASIEDIWGKISGLTGLVKDAGKLDISSLSGKRRSAGKIGGIDADLEIVYSVFDFLANNAPLFKLYVEGTFTIGSFDSFIEDFKFDVRELLIGMLYGATESGKDADYDYFDAREDYGKGAGLPEKYLKDNAGNLKDNAALILLQDLINDLVLGKWGILDEYLDDKWDEVLPGKEFYAFTDASGNDVSDEPIDTATYDYYGWIHPDQSVTVGLGGAKRVANGADAPAEDYDLLDIDKTDPKTGELLSGYDFIEALLQRAFNYVLVPILNRDSAPWLKKECGYTFLAKYNKKKLFNESTGKYEINPDYNPDYQGEAPANIENNVLYNFFKTENLEIAKVEIPAGKTLISQLNNLLGIFIGEIMKTPENQPTAKGNTWNWVEGDNGILFDNVCNFAKFVLLETGGKFFSSSVKLKPDSEIKGMSNQQVAAYIARAIINSSVDNMYIDDDCDSVADVAYAAIEQIGWQDFPQITYTKPTINDAGIDGNYEKYYDAVIEKALTILMDEGAYNLNQGLDVNKKDGELLPYMGDNGTYEDSFAIVGEWAFETYAPLLAPNFKLTAAGDQGVDAFWDDLDTLFDSIVPLKGDNGLLIPEIGNQQHVFKSLLLDYILKPIYTLDATNFVKLFDINETGLFQQDGVQIIMTILKKVFSLIFPNVFSNTTSTIDGLLNNELLGSMIYDLFKSFGRNSFSGMTNDVTIEGRADDIVFVGLPIVCMVLGLSDDQEFEELENYMPKTIPDSDEISFYIYNGSKGINTSYKKDGIRYVDEPYTYSIVSSFVETYNAPQGVNVDATISQTNIEAGQKATVTLKGYKPGMVLALNIVYNIKGEDGTNMTKAPLTSTTYAYVGNSSKDDDQIEKKETFGDRTLKYKSEIYIASGESLSDITDYLFQIEDLSNEGKTTGTASIQSVTATAPQTGAPLVVKNSAAGSVNLEGLGGTYFINPFEIGVNPLTGAKYLRYEDEYLKDEDGKYVLDEFGKKIVSGNNKGVEPGLYTINTTLNIGGTTKTITTRVHVYDDFDLDSIFDDAVVMNRQKSNYNPQLNSGAINGLWTNYTDALKQAATLALKPKNGDTFESDIQYTSGGVKNRYELYANEINDCIEALKDYQLSGGTDTIEEALAEFSGFNYDLKADKDGYNYRETREYDDPDNIYFSFCDYVAHTYNRYNDIRKTAEKLVNSQKAYLNHPRLEDEFKTEEEKAENYAERKAYDEFKPAIVSSVQSEYVTHMVELMGSRLIANKADKSKLNIVIDKMGTVDETIHYTAESKAEYDRAVAFANLVAADNSATLKPSKVNTAMNHLIEAWKELEEGCDYAAFNVAFGKAQSIASNGTPDEQDVYDDECYRAFYAVYQDAIALDKDLYKNDENQKKIADLTAALTNAMSEENLKLKQESATPVYEPVASISTFKYKDGTTYGPVVNDTALATARARVFGGKPEGAEHIIYGIAPKLRTSPTLFTVQNGTQSTTLNAKKKFSSGAVVSIKDGSGTPVDTYLVIVRGDTNGDGAVDASDALIINQCSASSATMGSYKNNAASRWVLFAADVNHSFSINTSDALLIKFESAKGNYIEQRTGQVQSYYAS